MKLRSILRNSVIDKLHFLSCKQELFEWISEYPVPAVLTLLANVNVCQLHIGDVAIAFCFKVYSYSPLNDVSNCCSFRKKIIHSENRFVVVQKKVMWDVSLKFYECYIFLWIE